MKLKKKITGCLKIMNNIKRIAKIPENEAKYSQKNKIENFLFKKYLSQYI